MATKVITGANTRWSYVNVWEPKAMEGGKPKLSVSLIIPKSDSVTVGKIRAAIEEAYRDGQSKLGLCRFGMRVLRVVDLKFIICIFDFGLQRFFENRKCRNETITYQ